MFRTLTAVVILLPSIAGAVDLWTPTPAQTKPDMWVPALERKPSKPDAVLQFCAKPENRPHRVCELERKMREARHGREAK